MRTIYLDHNIVHHFVRAFPTGTETVERAALQLALGMYPNVRFVVSDWNFIEPCRESDPVEGREALAIRYADFLESLKPLYLPTVLAIKRAELARCLFHHLKMGPLSEIPVFNEVYSQARAASGMTGILLGYGLKYFMLYLAKNPGELDQYRVPEQMNYDAQQTIKAAKESGRDKDPSLRRKLWHEWFGSMIPLRGPDDHLLASSDVQCVLEEFVDDPELVLSTCPAIRVESVLSDVRANVGGRNPRKQDAIDLMHSVPELAYCDAMVSNDKHVLRCGREVVKRTSRTLVLTRRLSEAIGKIC
jgi:hypothetical protein